MAMSMDLVNLTLGVVGTTSGIVSLAVHLWRLKREKPSLVLRSVSCTHEYEKETMALSFLSELEIRNFGDRGTNILGVDLKFDYKHTEYGIKTIPQDDEDAKANLKWIRPHETMRITQIALTRFSELPQKQIKCNLILHHTHGSSELKVTSTLM